MKLLRKEFAAKNYEGLSKNQAAKLKNVRDDLAKGVKEARKSIIGGKKKVTKSAQTRLDNNLKIAKSTAVKAEESARKSLINKVEKKLDTAKSNIDNKLATLKKKTVTKHPNKVTKQVSNKVAGKNSTKLVQQASKAVTKGRQFVKNNKTALIAGGTLASIAAIGAIDDISSKKNNALA